MSARLVQLIVRSLLESDGMDLVCHLGNDPGLRRIKFEDYWVPRWLLVWEPDGTYRQRMTFPVRTGPASPLTMFPEAYYVALDWLEANRLALQKRVCEDWDYPAQSQKYLPGNEVELVVSLSDSLKDIISDRVDPLLAATVLFKLGLDELYADFKARTPSDIAKVSKASVSRSRAASILETAIKLSPKNNNVDVNYAYASELLSQGDWKKAVKFYKKVLDADGDHVLALNDMAYILADNDVDTEKALDFAKRAFDGVSPDSHQAVGVLDTLGWAYFKHGLDLLKAENCLKQSLRQLSPYSDHYVTCLYHLIVVEKALGRADETTELYQKLVASTPRTLTDSQSYLRAQAFMGGHG